MTALDYATHPNFNPTPEVTQRYNATIRRIGEAFRKDGGDKAPLLAAAYADMQEFTPRRCRELFALGSKYSLAKEFFYETIAANAAVITRLLEQQGQVEQAKAFMIDLYRTAFDEGFTRGREFLVNRLDSRTFMPLRKHIDAEYLAAIGYTRPDNILLCVGDCQTVIHAEKVRDALPLRGIDIASYQHELGSLLDSPLEHLLHPVGYLYSTKLAADYALLGKSFDAREKFLQIARDIVAFLHRKGTRRSVFVTHVFFGVDNAVKHVGTPRDVCMDAVTRFSDDVAAILATAPGARLIHFQEICPFTPGTEAFRDDPDSAFMLHFRFDIMDAVHARIAEALDGLDDA